MVYIDQEIMQLVPLDQDGWPIFSEDRGLGLHDGHDDSIMRKAMEDAARPSIARAGDQRLATQLRQAGVDITQDMPGALKSMRQTEAEEAARKKQAQQAATCTPPPKQRKQGDDKLACPTPSKAEDKGEKGKGKGKGEIGNNKGKGEKGKDQGRAVMMKPTMSLYLRPG